MASNQESLGCGSVFTEDSFLLSDYLHRQAEKAGNRLFKNKNSWLFLRSKNFSSQFEAEEGEKTLGRCCPQVMEPMTVDLSSAPKESSESFLGKECSSIFLSDLDQQKGDSLFSQRSLASSNSCIESSPGCESESGFKSTTETRIANAKSLHNNLLCCQTKKEIFRSSCEMEDVKVAADAFIATKHDTEALDLLVSVAMQANGCNERHDAALISSSDAIFLGESFASAAHTDCLKPILRKRVVRRAKSAFQRPLLDNSAKPEFKFHESRRRNEIGCRSRDQQIPPLRHGDRAFYAKQKRLQDLPFKYADNSSKPCVVKDLRRHFLANIEDSPKKAVQTVEDGGNAINYRKLQISSSRFFDEYDAQRPESIHAEAAQVKSAAQLRIISSDNQLRFEDYEGVQKAHPYAKCNGDASLEKFSEANSTVRQAGDVKQVNSFLRLKILPVRQNNEDLTSQGHGSKMKNSDSVVQGGGMVTRNRNAQQQIEKGKACPSMTALSSFRQQQVTQTLTSQVMKSTDPVMRTKRGRSQVLPSKFSDSVLQPWKSSRRKMRTLDA